MNAIALVVIDLFATQLLEDPPLLTGTVSGMRIEIFADRPSGVHPYALGGGVPARDRPPASLVRIASSDDSMIDEAGSR
jgi:hypothetical protein